MSAVEEYRTGTSDLNRDADPRILSAIAGPAHFVMHLADAAIAELEAELAALRERFDLCRYCGMDATIGVHEYCRPADASWAAQEEG